MLLAGYLNNLSNPLHNPDVSSSAEIFSFGIGSEYSSFENAALTRYGSAFVEDFTTLGNIDHTNTTVGINPLNGEVSYQSSSHSSPSHVGNRNMNTHSHGGGYHPAFDQFWYPGWSGYTVYRHAWNGQQLGQFNLGEQNIMQLWGDIDGTFYTSHWGRNTIKKWSINPNNWQSTCLWTYHMGTTAAAVCCDNEYVYCMKWSDSRVYVLDKYTGDPALDGNFNQILFNLPSTKRCYGALAYANDRLYIGGYAYYNPNRYDWRAVHVYRIDIDNKQLHYETNWDTCENIYNMAYTGVEYCITDNDNDQCRYRISNGNSYYSGTAEPDAKVRYIQSKELMDIPTYIGSVRFSVEDDTPGNSNIIYNISLDGGKTWETIPQNENYIVQHRGDGLIWNATLIAEDLGETPSIERIVINYSRISDPEPYLPVSSIWQLTNTPKMEWNFTDPDEADGQSDFLVEIFDDVNLTNKVYNSSWVNSTLWEHTVTQDLEDGVYYWRVRTSDSYHAFSNYSVPKKIMLDTTLPVGNITLNGGNNDTNDQLITLTIFAQDNGSGINEMQITDDRGNAQGWEGYKTEKELALEPIDGLKLITVQFRDHAGLESLIYNDTIYLDFKGPKDILVSSPTHPDPDLYYNSTDPVFNWIPPFEVSGIKGYSYMVDESSLSEPYKFISDSNSGDKVSTTEGEFPGLKDGTWYFHILATDIYDQWSNTSHFKFNIDTNPPNFGDRYPNKDIWYKVSNIRSSIIISDIDGSGLDMDTLHYSYKKNNSDTFSPWIKNNIKIKVLDKGSHGYPERIEASVTIDYHEGGYNLLRWKVSDMATNGPVISKLTNVQVDMSPVSFSDPIPNEDDYSNDLEVGCGITILDAGSGVRGDTIEYSISSKGNKPKHFNVWNTINNRMVSTAIIVRLDIEFEAGKDNYIKWRAADVIGNGMVESESFRVWVNSGPVIQILSPKSGDEYRAGNSILLDSTGTVDPEQDEMSFYWLIKNKTSRQEVYSSTLEKINSSISKPGDYVVYLHADDGHGKNHSKKVNIRVLPKIKEKPVEPVEDPVEETKDEGGITSHMKDMWWLYLALLLLILLLVIIVVVRKRQEDTKPDTVQPVRSKPAAMVSKGRYSQPQSNSFSQPQTYAPPQRAFVNRPPSGGLARNQYPQTHSGGGYGPQSADSASIYSSTGSMLPQNTTTSSPSVSKAVLPKSISYGRTGGSALKALPPKSAVPSTNEVATSLEYEQTSDPIPEEPSTPTYTLPTFNTDQGEQNLSRAALPPAPVIIESHEDPDIPEEIIEAPLPQDHIDEVPTSEPGPDISRDAPRIVITPSDDAPDPDELEPMPDPVALVPISPEVASEEIIPGIDDISPPPEEGLEAPSSMDAAASPENIPDDSEDLPILQPIESGAPESAVPDPIVPDPVITPSEEPPAPEPPEELIPDRNLEGLLDDIFGSDRKKRT